MQQKLNSRDKEPLYHYALQAQVKQSLTPKLGPLTSLNLASPYARISATAAAFYTRWLLRLLIGRPLHAGALPELVVQRSRSRTAHRCVGSSPFRKHALTLSRVLSSVGFCFSVTLAHAAGFTFIEVPADKDGPVLRGAVWSPCSTSAGRISLGPLVIDGVKDCSISGARLPLVVISHGTGGSFLGHHDTAATLADAGFVVAAISHPGDNFQDVSRQAYLSAFATRPVDMKRLIDYMLGTWPGHAKLDADKIGIFGFSRGGYTGLAAIGAIPNWTLRKDLCPPGSTVPLCGEIRRNELPPLTVRDPRVKV